MGYTNSNVLFPAIDATGIGFGAVFNVTTSAGIRNPDGSFYRFGQPIVEHREPEPGRPNAAAAVRPVPRSAAQLPYTRQTSLGWSHQLTTSTVFTVDFVRIDGRDLNTRPRSTRARSTRRRRRRAGSRS